MRAELERRLAERWPHWFGIDGDSRHMLLPFGFEHGDGWFDLVWRLCDRLESVVAAAEKETGLSFQVLQVKQKFGGVRFYTNYSNDAISRLVETAQTESIHICEVCGGHGRRRSTDWVETKCEEHANAS